ncbi:RidA family protein [Salipiger abyssi]|uniref:Putative translation initiation inhibitor, yjgF family n=1 Tax=Salipiger abyssi TaxID=1250539 RepID=A0A1P8UM47_9RHOB|nr:RidA family protein [Salipiger abyssi]APZ50472.1 putative translation initiation inhibitor, yjgF family [Salipiger abyssi]
MRQIHNPDIAPPFGPYCHAVEVGPGDSLLAFSGLVGCEPDGTLPADAGEQTRLIFQTLARLLEGEGLGTEHVGKLNFFVTRREDLPAIRAARDAWLGDHRPAMSLVLVAGLGSEDWFLEVDGFAVRPGAAE